MWAQMLKTRMKPGQESTLQQLPQEIEARLRDHGSGRGPKHVIAMQDQNNPDTYYTLIVFESEEKAREYEGSPEAQEVQQRMMQVWAGPPEFIDLNVIHEINR